MRASSSSREMARARISCSLRLLKLRTPHPSGVESPTGIMRSRGRIVLDDGDKEGLTTKTQRAPSKTPRKTHFFLVAFLSALCVSVVSSVLSFPRLRFAAQHLHDEDRGHCVRWCDAED